jgi:hypothetical protein
LLARYIQTLLVKRRNFLETLESKIVENKLRMEIKTSILPGGVLNMELSKTYRKKAIIKILIIIAHDV